jgi:hypothetical protein
MVEKLLRLAPLVALAPFAFAASVIPVPPGYVCHRAPVAPVVDGKIDDVVWRDAAWTSDFGDIEGAAKPAPAKRTRVKMLWDDNFLYLAAELEESDLTATLRERDSVIFKDNDFEVFIDPVGDGRSYVELELNAFNTVWDLFLSRPYREHGHALHDWDIRGLKTAVALHGTLNKSGDKDKGWTVEVAIPWASLTGVSENPRKGAAPTPGSEMRINFSRVEWNFDADASSPSGYAKRRDASGKELPEMNWTWAPQHRVDMHAPEHWGVLRFVDSPPSSRIGYVADPDEALRAELFRLYRAQWQYRREKGAFAANLTAWVKPDYRLRGEKLSDLLRFENAGGLRYAIVATSPFTGDVWTMTDDGVVSRAKAPEAVRRAKSFKVWTWVHGGGGRPVGSTPWPVRFSELCRAGIDVVLIDGGPEALAKIAPFATAAGLQVHAWMWAMNQPDNKETLAHHDWYAVNRKGESCFDRRPYVDYYQFLCPTHPEVHAYLRERLAIHAAIPGVAGVQLDYIRLPDIILPRGLWEKYGLVMNREMPEYDFCYCPRCLAAFRAQYGRDPAADPTQDADWRRFRHDAVTGVVNSLREEADRCGTALEAAVFPYPSLSQKLVRQSWDAWPLDAALPMTYNGFYNEPDTWVGESVRKGLAENSGRFPIHAGLYLPDIPPEKLGGFIRDAFSSGASGIALFSEDTVSPAHAKALAEAIAALRKAAK